MRFRSLFFSAPVIQPASWPTSQPADRPRVPLVPLKNHGKRMFSALFCPDYIRCGGNGGTLGECQPCWAEPWGRGEGRRVGRRGQSKGKKKGRMRGEKRRGRWEQYAWRRREKGREGGMGMRRQGCWGPPGTRRLEGEQCDSSRPVRGLISGQEDGCGGGRWLWPREGQMVNDMTGFFLFFFFFFPRLGDMLPLSSQPCP